MLFGKPIGEEGCIQLVEPGEEVPPGRTVVRAPNAYLAFAKLQTFFHPPPASVPGVAPAAKQMGRHAARNILRVLSGQAPLPFRYRDFGMMATIGRNAAVAQFGRLRLSGYPAWLLWLLAHIWFLIGFRNRLSVTLDWAWAYWTFERHARIVIGEPREPGA